MLSSSQSGLNIQRIEGCLDKQQVHTTLNKSLDLLGIGTLQHIEIDCSHSRIIHLGRHRGSLTRRANRTRHKTGTLGRESRHTIGLSTCHSRRRKIDATHKMLGAVLGLRDGLRIECTSCDNIGSRLQICSMNGRKQIGTRKCKNIVIARKQHLVRRELLATIILLA